MRFLSNIFIIFLLFFSIDANAQYYWDIGGGLGGSNYLGEIGGNEKTRRGFVSDIKLNQTRPSVHLFVRYKFTPDLFLKGSLTGLRIQGNDNLSTNPARVGRNLHFRNDMLELAATAQYSFYRVNDVGNNRRNRVDFASYVYFGVAAFYHNPKAQYQGEWVSLRPLRTEGVNYSPVSMAIPLGVGFHYTFKRKHRIGWEFGWRKTFTDYLDDISGNYATPEQLNNNPVAIAVANRRNELNDPGLPHPKNYEPPGNGNIGKRGDPKYKDNYFVSTINYSYVIRGKSSFYRSKYSFIFGNKRKKRKSRAKF